MKTRHKLLTALILASSAAAGTYAINRAIKMNAISANLLGHDDSHCFNWRLGNIHYIIEGTGSPLLLLHDLDPASCGYEWNKLVPELTDSHTVYVPDLIGCGRSEKPDMTYTNFLYVQMICDFIRSEIGKRTSVIACGAIVPSVIMACKTCPELFDKLVFISPDSPDSGMIYPGKRAKSYKFILDMPILGTLLYNISASKQNLAQKFAARYFFNPYNIPEEVLDTYFESSHLGDAPKSLYASLTCNYVRMNFKPALAELDHSITLITGASDPESTELADAYSTINPSVESVVIGKCKRYPQLEQAEELASQLKVFI